ncbi:MAG TPA: glutaredoxin family protein [Candidatus Binatia bacterium]|jgi:glutaredoxin|nr:glutaredoxin family protein [Candidatus Binatia bacterium]
MKPKLTLYSRQDCGLCDEMKEVVRAVASEIPLEMEEIDVDRSNELREKFGNEVPVLFINGRKAFKYRVSTNQLEKRLMRRSPISWLGSRAGGA